VGFPDDGQGSAAPEGHEGLRERKKRLTRQLISDTATGMFLAEGYDAVRVVDVAAACGVSEKTVYNYFPTKESLILDRLEEIEADVRRLFGADSPLDSPAQAAVALICRQLDRMLNNSPVEGIEVHPWTARRFSELVRQTPALRTAQWDFMDRLVQVAAAGLSVRAGLRPDDPEPQITAHALLGLWQVMFRSMERYADGGRTMQEVRDRVVSDVRRAALVLETGLARVSSR
jgi:AcrR family transcriptional regulator